MLNCIYAPLLNVNLLYCISFLTSVSNRSLHHTKHSLNFHGHSSGFTIVYNFVITVLGIINALEVVMLIDCCFICCVKIDYELLLVGSIYFSDHTLMHYLVHAPCSGSNGRANEQPLSRKTFCTEYCESMYCVPHLLMYTQHVHTPPKAWALTACQCAYYARVHTCTYYTH